MATTTEIKALTVDELTKLIDTMTITDTSDGEAFFAAIAELATRARVKVYNRGSAYGWVVANAATGKVLQTGFRSPGEADGYAVACGFEIVE